MRKIKILYTIPNFDTAGSGIALMKVINGLDKGMFDIHIAVNHTRGKYFKDVVVQSGVTIHVTEVTKPLRPFLPAITNILSTIRFFRKYRFDIVYSYNWSSDFYEALAARLAGCKWVYFKKNMGWNKFWRIRCLFANHIAVQNTFMLGNFFHNSTKCSFMPVGVDMNEFYPKKQDVELLTELGIEKQTKTILFLANLVKVKGVEILIEAIKILKFPTLEMPINIAFQNRELICLQLYSWQKRLPAGYT